MEKEKKQNNKIIIILFIVIIILLIGIIIKQKQDIKEIKETVGIEDKQTDRAEKEISKEEFRKYIKQVDITTENWKDYFEIEKETDGFGDVISTQNAIILSLKNNYYNEFDTTDISLEIEIPEEKAFDYNYTKQTVQLLANNNKTSISTQNFLKDNESITIDDIECTSATGTIYYLDNIPNEYWNIEEGHTVGGKTEAYINVEGTRYYKYNSNYKYLKDFME